MYCNISVKLWHAGQICQCDYIWGETGHVAAILKCFYFLININATILSKFYILAPLWIPHWQYGDAVIFSLVATQGTPANTA